jgi:CRISPR-associated protein Cas2
MFVVVAYDIVDDRKRLRVAKLMKQYGVRVQKSVFECILDDRRYLKMKAEIEKLIDWEDDGVRYYILCAGCVKNIETSGVGSVLEDEEVIVV